MSQPTKDPALQRTILLVLGLWSLAVVFGAQSGFLSSLYQPIIGALVALSIALPTLVYFGSPRFRTYMDGVGHRRLVAFHTWRVPAALLFFWYGAHGHLPPVFWILAGVGDLIAGLFAMYLLFRPESTRRLWSFHLFGFADFVVAVGTGLVHTLLFDPRMAPIAVLPMALIPLFGVGISGTTHLMAFDMLRRGSGRSRPRSDLVAVPA